MGSRMKAPTSPWAVESLAAAQNVTVLAKLIRVRQLNLEQPSVVRYLGRFPAEKLEIALVHALEVGIVEMQARREGRR
jgi:hypothetical protein